MFVFNTYGKRLKSPLFHVIKFYSSLGENAKSVEEKLIFPECGTKLLKVGIIGLPNAGKSTLINNLLDRMVCPASSKVHTTRSRSTAIFNEGVTQIVFLDTPGLVNEKELSRYNLENTFKRDAQKALKEADIIGVIHDVSNSITRDKLDIKIIKLLDYNSTKPSFLIFNKIDILKSKRKLLDLTRSLTNNHIGGKLIPGIRIKTAAKDGIKAWTNFQEIFMVSALTGDGTSDVMEFLLRNAKPNEWMFPQGIWSDQSAETIILKMVEAKLLDFLPQEIPYILKSEVEYFHINDNGVVTTVVLVHCPSSRMAKLVAGTADGRLRQITESVQDDLQRAFQNFVKIRIVVTPTYKE